ncbi:hypothetical protein O5623_19425 [Escherichia coli]|nr:hypothetical protein [Escherichia coli]
MAQGDLGIALDVANQLHVPMPLGAVSREVYSQARAAGRGRRGLVRHSGTGPCQCRDDCQSKNVTTG